MPSSARFRLWVDPCICLIFASNISPQSNEWSPERGQAHVPDAIEVQPWNLWNRAESDWAVRAAYDRAEGRSAIS